MLDLIIRTITIATEVPYSYLVQRIGIRLLNKSLSFIPLALFLTFLLALIYFILCSEEKVERAIKTQKQLFFIRSSAQLRSRAHGRRKTQRPVSAAGPTTQKSRLKAPGLTRSKVLYKQRREKKRKEREEIIDKATKNE